MTIKIRGFSHQIAQSKVEKTMTYVKAIADSVVDEDVGSGMPGSGTLKELYWHARNDHLPISSEVVQAISRIVDQKNNGQAICAFLFGDNWAPKALAGIPLKIEDPEIRAIIAAAHPQVSVSYENPIDLSHSPSREHDKKEYRRMRDEEHDLGVTLAEDIDHNPAFMPERPGQHWRSFCRNYDVHQGKSRR